MAGKDGLRRPAVDSGTSGGVYRPSTRIRRRAEEMLSWIDTVSGLGRVRNLGRGRTEAPGYLVGAAYDLFRLARLSVARVYRNDRKHPTTTAESGKALRRGVEESLHRGRASRTRCFLVE